MTDAPAWATRQKAERVETKAAHLVALLQMREQLDGANKSKLAAALGISRWTLDRYLASLPEVESRVADIQKAIDSLNTQEIRTMNTYYIEPAMLGDEATDADAERMVELLQLRNIDAEIGSALQNRGEDIVSEKTWEECLDIISAEKYA